MFTTRPVSFHFSDLQETLGLYEVSIILTNIYGPILYSYLVKDVRIFGWRHKQDFLQGLASLGVVH